MSTLEERRESRLRQQARRQGYALSKSRARVGAEAGLFRIDDPDANYVVAGGNPLNFSMTLDEVEEWLGPPSRNGVAA